MSKAIPSGAPSPSYSKAPHMPKSAVIFCDFDGTITVNDNIMAIFEYFQPSGWREIVQQIVTQRISIKQGVGQLFMLLPSADKNEVIRYAIDNVTVRSGFRELLQFCKGQQIEFLVTSGGIDFFVHPVLSEFKIDPRNIYCNSCDFSGSALRILWPYPCDEHCQTGCGMCKTSIIRAYPKEQYKRILIGDGITDFEASKLSDIIFARSSLADKCRQLAVPYYAYEDFHDIIRDLQSLLD